MQSGGDPAETFHPRQTRPVTEETRAYWDAQAAGFDDEADHGLRDPVVRAAWTELLLPLLPPAPARVADLGCGTGTVSTLFADHGYDVHGVDVSPAMVERATSKSVGSSARFDIGDAAAPPIAPGSVDVVFARHVLWTFDDPDAVLARWVELLVTGGTLLLVEGRWSTGAGIPAEDCRRLVRRFRPHAEVRLLTDPVLWGGEIEDERYLVRA